MSKRDEALKWLEKYDHNYEENLSGNRYQITNDGVISCTSIVDICENKLSELPFKFDIVQDFVCDTNKLKNFKNFPNKVLGGLDAYDNRFEDFSELPKEVGEHINILSKKNAPISDLNIFMEHKFGEFIIKYEDGKRNVFLEDEIPAKYLDYITYDDDNDLIITGNNFKVMIDKGLILDETIFDDYLDNYDLSKEPIKDELEESIARDVVEHEIEID